MMQKVHFRLPSVAQQRCYLSSHQYSNPSKRGLSAGVVSEKISILGQFLQEVSVGLILFIGSLVSAL